MEGPGLSITGRLGPHSRLETAATFEDCIWSGHVMQRDNLYEELSARLAAVMPNKIADLLNCHRFRFSCAAWWPTFRGAFIGLPPSITDRSSTGQADSRRSLKDGESFAPTTGKRAAALYRILNKGPYRPAVKLDTQGTRYPRRYWSRYIVY